MGLKSRGTGGEGSRKDLGFTFCFAVTPFSNPNLTKFGSCPTHCIRELVYYQSWTVPINISMSSYLGMNRSRKIFHGGLSYCYKKNSWLHNKLNRNIYFIEQKYSLPQGKRKRQRKGTIWSTFCMNRVRRKVCAVLRYCGTLN